MAAVESSRSVERRQTAAEPSSASTMWTRLRFYARYGWRFVVQQRPEPLICGVALTDRCNLSCRGCRVSNTGRPDTTWEQLVRLLRAAWDRGFRELYLSGGEPMLWRDGEYAIEDAIAEARRIGFFHVHVYTNGTLGLDTSADLTWVSMDGLPGTFERRRGDYFQEVERAVLEAKGRRLAVIYTIDRNTAGGMEPFLRWVRDTRFPVVGVMIYFYTPYYGRDDLFLNAEERAPLIDRLITCGRARLPVMNYRAGLLALRSGDWPRRFPVAAVADVDGECVCCRAPDETCADCGYAACTELTEFQRLRPSAVLRMMRYW